MKVKQFVKDHKKEFIIGAGALIIGGVMFAVTRKKPNIPAANVVTEAITEAPMYVVDDAIKFIQERTGVDVDTIVKVLTAEDGYLIKIGVMEEIA